MTDTPTPPATAREWHLVSRPVGWPEPENFALVEAEVRTPGEGQVLVRNEYLSVDPYMRGRMSAAKSYVAPYELGKAMQGGAVGEVVASNAEGISVGDHVLHFHGWREYAVVDAKTAVKVDPQAAPCRRTWASSACPASPPTRGCCAPPPSRRATPSSCPARPAPSAARSARSPGSRAPPG